MSRRKQMPDLPTTAQLEHELKRLRYRAGFIRTLWSTLPSLIVVSAIAVTISTMLFPVLRVTGTSMTQPAETSHYLTAYDSPLLIEKLI